MSETIIINSSISKENLIKIAKQRFGDMVKGVIDISTKELALGGELHADQEAILIQNGNKQENLWGINIYVDEEFPENIEFDSIINIRPSQNNRSRNVEDPGIQKKILTILEELLK
jgi:hypothetical protein